jgi:hypothetical protein
LNAERAPQLKAIVILLLFISRTTRFSNIDTFAKNKLDKAIMDYDEGKVDEMVLALLYLTSSNEQSFVRAWKGHDWDALNRLHKSGLISDPKNKDKSIVLSQ